MVYSDQTNIHFGDDTRISVNTTGLTVTAATYASPPAVGLTIPVIVANGGTGAITHTTGNVLLGNGTSPFAEVAPGTSGNVLTSNGTTWTSAAPSGGGGTGITSLTLSGGTTGLQINGATSSTLTANGTFTISGTLGVPFGGTGATSLSGYIKGSGTSAFTASSTIPGSDISGTVANATTAATATTATTATSATTATNLSGGSASGTSASWSGTDTASNFIATAGSGVQFSVGSNTGLYGSAGSTAGLAVGGVTQLSASSTQVFIAGGVTSLSLASGVAAAYSFFSNWTNISDERTKKNIEDYSVGLSTIQQIRPRKFQYNGVNNTPTDDNIRVGLIAQEVQATGLSSMVINDPVNDGYLAVNNGDLIYALVNAVKELSARVVALEAKVP